MPFHKLQPTRPPTNSDWGNSKRHHTSDQFLPQLACGSTLTTRHRVHPPTHSTTPTCGHSRTNFLTTPTARPDTPPAGHSSCIPSSSHKARSLPRGPDPVGAHGSRVGGESACARGAGTPQPPTPRQTRRPLSPSGPKYRWGRGSGRKKTHVSVPGQEKVWFPPPFPAARRWLTLRGAGMAEPARSALCSELGPEGEGRGLGSHLRTAPPKPCAQTPCWPPPAPESERFPNGRLSSRSAGPRVPTRTNFLRVAGPTRPAPLARLGVTDASETDFPLFQRKGELARAPQPPSPGPFPLPPPAAVTLDGPLLGSAAAGGGGALPAVSNVHFLNQTNPPPARSPWPGVGAALSQAGIVRSWAPPEGPRKSFQPAGVRHSPPPAPAHTPQSGLTNTRAHTPTISRARTTPPPPPGPEKESFQVVRAPPARLCPPPAPRTDFSERLFLPRGPRLGPGRPGRGRGAPGERAAYLPGLTLGLTARGWKAPRGLTSDPLSTHPPRPALSSPSPTRPEGENKLCAERDELRPPPAGRAVGGQGLHPAHRSRRGRGLEGTFFLRPPPPSGMPHGL